MKIIPAIHDFQLNSLSGLSIRRKNSYFFIHKNQSRNCDAGWVLCHISMVFISIPFKPPKGTPMMVSPST